jgi:hypothetical protein
MNTDTMGVYGYYLKRAIITRLGLGANLPEDAIYPLNLGDDPERHWMVPTPTSCISTRAPPPVNAFWSVRCMTVTLQVANSLNRFAVSSWMPFKYDPEGSLDL